MKYALVDGIKSEASHGIHHERKCVCLECGAEVVAKCGERGLREKHWAHKTNEDCWYSKKEMTEWHRRWQAQFDEKCREVPVVNMELNKKHVADVKTEDGLVIEFQHSPISAEERNEREAHYTKNNHMIWVVDGNCRKYRFSRLLKNLHNFNQIRGFEIPTFEIANTQDVFPRDWMGGLVPIVFDYKVYSDEPIDEQERIVRNALFVLYPQQINGMSYALHLPHDIFVNLAKRSDKVGKRFLPEILLGYWQSILQLKGIQKPRVVQRPPMQIFVSPVRRPRRFRF